MTEAEWIILGASLWLSGWIVSTVALLLRILRVRSIDRRGLFGVYLAMFVWWPVIAGMMTYEHFEGRR